MKSFHRDTFELPRRIQVWDNFQNITPRQYKNFHLGHFILHGNTSLSLRTLSFQRLSITFLKYFLLCFIALWSYFTTYFYIGLQFSDFFFHCETIRNRCLAQLTESLTVHILPAPPPPALINMSADILLCLLGFWALYIFLLWYFHPGNFDSWSQDGYYTSSSHLFKVGITESLLLLCLFIHRRRSSLIFCLLASHGTHGLLPERWLGKSSTLHPNLTGDGGEWESVE